MNDSATIAQLIKERMRIHGITNKQLAESVKNVNVNTISQLAKGREISYVTFADIADYLSCSVDYLLGRSDDPNMIVNISDNNQSNVNGNNNIQVFPIDDNQKEINSILSQLSPRERTELMMMIYQFADEHIKNRE